jgi:nicotinate-nucleotide adenylyltransferase
MAIALYGGTFDPIHHGHLILARDAIEQLSVDRVIFIPAAISPHKLMCTPSPAKVRSAMVAAAISGEARFLQSDMELHRDGPSFTADTVDAIKAAHPNEALLYLIGEDNVPKLDTWHRIGDLRRRVEFVVFGRGMHATPHDFRILARRLDISSTDIRERIARGASIRYLVPETVRALIEQHHLYQSQTTVL